MYYILDIYIYIYMVGGLEHELYVSIQLGMENHPNKKKSEG